MGKAFQKFYLQCFFYLILYSITLSYSARKLKTTAFGFNHWNLSAKIAFKALNELAFDQLKHFQYEVILKKHTNKIYTRTFHVFFSKIQIYLTIFPSKCSRIQWLIVKSVNVKLKNKSIKTHCKFSKVKFTLYVYLLK